MLRTSLFSKFLLPFISAAAAFVSYSPLLKAQLGYIDDHEFLTFLRVSQAGVSGIPEMLESTEVGHYGDTARFRPVYYSLRAFETIIHGTDGFQWYLTRLTLFSLVIGTFVFLVQSSLQSTSRKNWTSIIVTAGFASFILLMPAWSDVASRLGPSELYMAAGIGILLLGAKIYLTGNRATVSSILIVTGFMLAAGSKENAISLQYLVIALVVFGWTSGFNKINLLMTLAFSLAFTLFVSLGFLPFVLRSGKDVYGQSRSLATFIQVAMSNAYFWITVAAVLVSLLILRKAPTAANPRPQTLSRILLILTPFILVITELYSYQNAIIGSEFIPARYGVVTEISALAAVLYAVVQVKSLSSKQTFTWLTFIFATGYTTVLFFSFIPSATQTYSRAQQNADYLNYQYAAITQVANQLNSSDTDQVVYIVDEPYDYEKIFASRLFLENLSGKNLKFFLQNSLDSLQADSVTQPLVDDLATRSESGYNEWRVLPFGQLEKTKDIACVYFGQEPVSSPCATNNWIGG